MAFRRRLLFVLVPDIFYGFFLSEACWDGFGRCVGPVPALISNGVGQCSAAGHLEVAVGVVPAYPVPGIPEPVVAVFCGLVSEPADFVISPYIVHADVLAGPAA